MKILYVIPSLRAGGKERRFIELIKSLKSSSDLSIYVILMSDEIAYPEFENLNIEYAILKREHGKDIKYFSRLLKVIREIAPDLIHSWAAMSTFYSIFPSKILGIPLITNEISTSFQSKDQPLFDRIIQSLNFKFCNLIISNSSIGITNSNAPTNKSVVIHNGVHLDRFKKESIDEDLLKRIYPKLNNNIILIMVAAFRSNKRYDMLVELAKAYQEEKKSVIFVAVGNGEDLDSVKELVFKQGITNIIFTGLLDNVESYLANSDIGLLLTEGEGISNSVMEYMASGLPVVVTDLDGGTSELFDNQTAGFITSLTFVEAKEKINLLIDNESLRHKMGKNGRKIINEEFNIKIMSNKFVEAYKKVCKDYESPL